LTRVEGVEVVPSLGSKPCQRYRAAAKVKWHWDELLPRVGFIVTTMANWAREVVHLYNRRGTTAPSIKECNYALKWTRFSCRSFKDNQARLQLLALAYNLGNFLRRLALPRAAKQWSLISARRECGRSSSRSEPR
jgi:hypothetical protein